jgi:hypothetical protein
MQRDDLASILGIQDDPSNARRKSVALEAFEPCVDFGLENRYQWCSFRACTQGQSTAGLLATVRCRAPAHCPRTLDEVSMSELDCQYKEQLAYRLK